MTVFVGKGSVFQKTISASLTTVAGVRNFKFNPGENETMETDDLASSYVTLQETGRAGGGSCSGQLLWDPANATQIAMHISFNTPTVENYSNTYGSTTESIAYTGILTKFELTVERADPIVADFEIAVADRPTLNEA